MEFRVAGELAAILHRWWIGADSRLCVQGHQFDPPFVFRKEEG